MIKPTVLCVWPKHIDFPLFRFNLERFRDYFDDIFISFTNHHQEHDYSNFIKDKLYFAKCSYAPRTEGDWRSDAVNQLLDLTTDKEYVLFLEQDFLIKDESFFKIFNEKNDFIYYQEMGRIHPAFALVKRSLVEQTSRDFSPVPPKDHFGKFFEELPEGKNIEDMGVKFREDFYHMQGLTQNYLSFKYGDAFFRPNTFFYFNNKCLNLPDQNPHFKGFQEQIKSSFDFPKNHEFLDRFFP